MSDSGIRTKFKGHIMYLNTIFHVLSQIIEDILKNIFFRKLFRNTAKEITKTISKVICTIIGILTVVCMWCIYDFILSSIDSFIIQIGFIITSLIILSLIIGGLIVFSIYGLRFDSFNEEIEYIKNSPQEKHNILSILYETDHDYFVLADFYESGELRPAVFTKYKNKIGIFDLRTDVTYFKKIYLKNSDDDSEKCNIRVRRIKNKSTKSQMIFFATSANNLELHFNNEVIPKINCYSKIGEFSIYGIIENNKNTNCNVVQVNGLEYPLIETTVQYFFINKKEI